MELHKSSMMGNMELHKSRAESLMDKCETWARKPFGL